jgi:ribosomal protein S7
MQKDYIVLKKLLNILIKEGKKAQALRMVLFVIKFLNIKNNKKITGEEIILNAVSNLKPQLYIEKQRKSRRIFYLPKIINSEKKINLALHWIVNSIKLRKEKKVEERLAKEFLDCFFNKGLSILKKRSLYKTLSANRPFFHLLKKKR